MRHAVFPSRHSHRISFSLFYFYFILRFDPAVKTKTPEEVATLTLLSCPRTQVSVAFLVIHKICICLLHSQEILLSKKLNNVYFFLSFRRRGCWLLRPYRTGDDGHWEWGRGTGLIWRRPAPVPQPQAPVPQLQAPVPQPQAPVPQPQALVPQPQAPAPQPQAPVPGPLRFRHIVLYTRGLDKQNCDFIDCTGVIFYYVSIFLCEQHFTGLPEFTWRYLCHARTLKKNTFSWI